MHVLNQYKWIFFALTFSAVLIAFAMVAPVLLEAQEGVTTQIVPCEGPNCDFCSLTTLAQRVLNFGIFLAVMVSAALFAWAGFLFLTNRANPTVIGRAKSIFVDVAVGLVLILSAWLIVDTLMKTLTAGKFGPWNEVCSSGTSIITGQGGGNLPSTLFGN